MKIISLAVLLSSIFIARQGKAFQDQTNKDTLFVIKEQTPTLTLDEFYKVILAHHPVVKQAELLSTQAQEELRFAKGFFDPKAVASFDHKEFEDKTYYSKLDAYLSLPTWFPVNPKIGYQQNTGQLLNSEEAIPGGRQWYAGVSVPIGKGFFTDERRTIVKQATLLKDIAVADQIKMINKILLDAAKDYWQWYYHYYHYRLASQAVSIAGLILSRTKMNMEQGEAAVIDTVQARITWQSRLIERQEAYLELQNSAIAVSNYLWQENAEPLQINTTVAPVLDESASDFKNDEALEELVTRATENHPELIKLNLKSEQLHLERALAKENLKPQLDFNYYLLSQPSAPNEVDPLNDYKIGLDFSFPVFLRKERAKLKLNEIKIENNTYQLRQVEREIINEIMATYNELKNTTLILSQQKQAVALYSILLQSETLNLDSGESDVFKINIQQEKLLQSQTKLLKLSTDLQKTKAYLYWAAGVKNLKL